MTVSPAQHRTSIDLARFLAAFGVVWAHGQAPGLWVGNLSLALFLILTAFLGVQSMERAGGRFSWVRRARRIALPWLVWSALFRVLQLVTGDDPGRFVPLREPATLLIGSSLHLWFLPFVMLVSVLIPLIGHRLGRRRDLALACAGLVAVSLPLLWLHAFLAMPAPLPQWAFGLPPFLYGILAASGHRFGSVWLPLTAMAAVSAVSFAATGEPWALALLAAALLFEGFWRAPISGRWLPLLGSAAFGIYLVHPFFMLVCYKLFGPQVNPVFAACLCFLLSWAATLILLRIPGLRRVV